MKEAAPSSLTPLLQVEQPSWTSEAERIVTIQKKMQNRVPALLSTSHFRGKDYIMQEMQRSSGRRGSAITDELIKFANNDSWQNEIIAYALDYSNRVKDYYREFLESFYTQRIAAPVQQLKAVGAEIASAS